MPVTLVMISRCWWLVLTSENDAGSMAKGVTTPNEVGQPSNDGDIGTRCIYHSLSPTNFASDIANRDDEDTADQRVPSCAHW